MMIGATYWALGEYLLWTADSADGLAFWLHASAFWPFVAALCVYFIITFTGRWPKTKKMSMILRVLLFVPALVFSLAGMFTDTLFTVDYVFGIGWVYEPVFSSVVYLVSGLYMIVIMVWATGATMVAWQRAERESTRQQSGLVCVGLVGLIICGTLSAIIFPHMGIYLPNLIFIGSMVFAIFIVSAIQQYGLFSLSPETVVPEILRTLPDGVILINPSGKILVANPSTAKLLGVPDEDLSGQEIGLFLPPAINTTLRSALTNVGTISDLEVSFARRPCSVGSISGTLVRDLAGRTAGFILIIRDISDRKAAEISLRVANEKITILSKLTRHDVGNLMTALTGYLDLVGEKNTNPEIASYLAASNRIVEKISRHLQFSREYQEIGSHQPAWQQLEGLITQGIKAFPHESVAIAVTVDPVEIYTDPLAFKVMYNIFENAIRHGGNVTKFCVTSQKNADGSLSIIFKDNGSGIEKEDKQRIFDYGYGSHTGIGLSLSRDILLMTGITIAETGEPGKGARFEIHVPAAAWRSARVRTW